MFYRKIADFIYSLMKIKFFDNVMKNISDIAFAGYNK